MRPLVLLFLVLAACGKPAAPKDVPAQAAPLTASLVLRGRVVRVEWDENDQEREVGPAAGVRVKAKGGSSVAGETEPRRMAVGPAVTDTTGAFELPVPEGFAAAIGSRSTWGWWIDVRAEDDEHFDLQPLSISEPLGLQSLLLKMPMVRTDGGAEVRKIMEALRDSPRRKDFGYEMDVSDHMDDEDGLVADLSSWASSRRSALRALQEYQKDRDPHLRALAYGVLAWQGDCEDDADRPAEAEDPETARRLLDWSFKAVATSKHGGHLALGVDLDDGCTRCYGIWEDATLALEVLGPDAAKAYLASRAGKPGQPEILRRLLWSELGSLGKRRRTPMAELDFYLLPAAKIEGGAILFPGEGLTSMIVRPERDAEPVQVTPSWLQFTDPHWSADAARVIGKGQSDDLWVLDLRSLRGGRAAWGGIRCWKPRWLPGDRAVFIALREPERELRVLDVRTGASIKVGSAAGMGEFDVDREGRRIVAQWVEGEDRFSVRIIDLATGRSEPLLDRRSKLPPGWSPDGRRVAVGLDTSLAVVDVATRDVRTLAPLLDEVRAPYAWSPDGTRIAWVHAPAWEDRKGRGRLMLSTLDGAPPKPLAEFESPLGLHAPAWSPDGTRLAFVAPKGDEGWIYVVTADGDTLFPVCRGGSLGPSVEDPLQWRSTSK